MTPSLTSAQCDRLNEIRTRDGMLETSRVVADARDPASPLHVLFEWDDNAAAEDWRLLQAKMILKVVVRNREAKMPPRTNKAVVRVTEQEPIVAIVRESSPVDPLLSLISELAGIAAQFQTIAPCAGLAEQVLMVVEKHTPEKEAA